MTAERGRSVHIERSLLKHTRTDSAFPAFLAASGGSSWSRKSKIGPGCPPETKATDDQRGDLTRRSNQRGANHKEMAYDLSVLRGNAQYIARSSFPRCTSPQHRHSQSSPSTLMKSE